MKRRNYGQEATEFVLICILVFFSALLVMFMFGGKISKFFTEQSSAVLASKGTSTKISTTSQPKYSEAIESYTGPTQTTSTSGNALPPPSGTTISLGGQQVTENADGSLSFVASGQNVTISAQMVDLANSVFQTTGSSGASDLIKEIAYMIQKYQAEYPGGNVPLEISYGTGNRYAGTGSYSGSASVNTINLSVGNHLVIIQKDQSCTPPPGQYCAFTGQYRIEGNISNGSFTGNTTSTANTPNHPTGTVTSTVDLTNGVKITKATFNQKDDFGSRTYNWDFDFTKTANQFNI